MRSKSGPQPSAEQHVREICHQTRKRYSSEERIRIVLEGLRGEYSIAELCRREGIAQGLYYKWSKEFLEAGKKRLSGDTERQATSSEVKDLRRLSAAVGVDDVHLHDMRRSIATWCGDNGVRPDVIERILSHKPRDVTRRHYNFAGMDELVRDALQAWADHIGSLVLAKQSPLKKTSSMASRQLSVLLD